MSEPFVIKEAKRMTQIRFIDEKGQFFNDMNIYLALKKAQELDMSLVCLETESKDKLPLCKIMDFGKWKYENEKKKKQQERDGKRDTKEMKFTPVIEDHDIEYKVKQIQGFLEDGDDVILLMIMKGRQSRHADLAEQKMTQIISLCTKGKEVNRRRNENTISVRLSKK